jgi:hypothetical protein
MIQLPHEGNRDACVRAIQAIQKHGSHLMTHIDWGCKAGVHIGWAIVEADSVQMVIMMVPAECRKDTTITELNRFTTEEMASWTLHPE